MWAIFQTHRVVQSFIDVQFKSHPTIVKEISLFMVTERVDPKEIADLGVKCKKAEADASKTSVDLKKLTESHNELKRKYESLFADFKVVNAKVK
jgi:glucose-6-phosphate 1-dehydrogenase